VQVTFAIDSLQKDYLQQMGPKSVSFARLMMDENRRICEAKLASIRTLETKAISQVTAAGTILGLLTAFGAGIGVVFRDAAIAMLVVAILAYLRAAYVRSGTLPSFGHYLSKSVMSDPLNEARVATLAAGAWRDYSLEVEKDNAIKAQFVKAGNFWLQSALIAILVAVLLNAMQVGILELRRGAIHPGERGSVSRSVQSVRQREGRIGSGWVESGPV
jgi:hypothetical protein